MDALVYAWLSELLQLNTCDFIVLGQKSRKGVVGLSAHEQQPVESTALLVEVEAPHEVLILEDGVKVSLNLPVRFSGVQLLAANDINELVVRFVRPRVKILVLHKKHLHCVTDQKLVVHAARRLQEVGSKTRVLIKNVSLHEVL